MGGLVFTLRGGPAQAVDVGALLPERLAVLALDEIARIPLPCGNRVLPCGELFAITGTPGETLTLRPDGGRLLRAGAAMTEGRLVVEGHGGEELARSMAGGELLVTGDAGDGAGAAMKAGVLVIEGSAGEAAGGGLAGDPMGMTGGLVVVRGSAGPRAGERMRRGTILVEGAAGDFAAARMFAGTLIVLGAIGRYPGFQMRRGSILAAHAPAALLPGFADHGTHSLGFIGLLESWLRPLSPHLAGRFAATRRLTGDSAARGTGELLIAA
ncbi:MAG: formylmethanofuran dehydrogenase subunit C [Acetobacteraceae bacterium]